MVENDGCKIKGMDREKNGEQMDREKDGGVGQGDKKQVWEVRERAVEKRRTLEHRVMQEQEEVLSGGDPYDGVNKQCVCSLQEMIM